MHVKSSKKIFIKLVHDWPIFSTSLKKICVSIRERTPMQEHEDEYIRTKFQQTELSKGEFNTQKTDGRVIKYHLFWAIIFAMLIPVTLS